MIDRGIILLHVKTRKTPLLVMIFDATNLTNISDAIYAINVALFFDQCTVYAQNLRNGIVIITRNYILRSFILKI